jgi:SpoVK/Ycf46/Vps4 family AAA+-type ATPase
MMKISAGELKVSARELEGQLSLIFRIASHWNALLLLDEADVFLEKRSSENILRNSLVAVFLRKLEYFAGILFLTSNRESDFDEAILSRIHLKLRYSNLGADARKKVWEHYLAKACADGGADSVSKGELDSLVSKSFNGRQVCSHLSPSILLTD